MSKQHIELSPEDLFLKFNEQINMLELAVDNYDE